MDRSCNYFLVTPCKNEGSNLPNLIDSVANQTIRPVLWVILDDGSTDNTQEIVNDASKKYKWVKYIQFHNSKRDIGLHLATIIKYGFDFATDFCNKNGINYDYLGNVDGDLTLNATFFENIIKEFEKDTKLGIASGGTNHIIGDRIVHAEGSVDEPSGGHMLIRKSCYDSCGGFPISYACDSVLKAKARLRGWKTKRFEESIATEIRDVSSAEGYWKGYLTNGKAHYYLNFNPLHVIIKGTKYFFKKPYLTMGTAYIVGYFTDYCQRKPQIEDVEVKNYFWNKFRKRLYM